MTAPQLDLQHRPAREYVPISSQPKKSAPTSTADLRASRRAAGAMKWGFVLVAIAVGLRLAYLQSSRHAHFASLAARYRIRPIPLTAKRGSIIDRGGRPLATTTQYTQLTCDPTQVKQPLETAAILAPILGKTVEDLAQRMTVGQGAGRRNIEIVPEISAKQSNEIQKIRRDPMRVRLLDGINFVQQSRRVYPSGAEVAQIIGFLNQERPGHFKGVQGLEMSLEKSLAGKSGNVEAEVDPQGRIIPETQTHRLDPVHGLNVRLSLDSAVQHLAKAALEEAVERFKPAGANAIVLDPRTGDILAMVSSPTFDPQHRGNLSKELSELANRAIQRYEPGSTAKILTCAAALDAGIVTPTDQFRCAGTLQIANKRIKCVLHGDSERNGHGWNNVEGIIQHSCNVGAAQIAMKLGMPKLRAFLERCRLFEAPGLGLPGEYAGTLGFGTEALNESKSKTARVGFGQSILMTPINLTTVFAAMYNDGRLIPPRLILNADKPGARIADDPEPNTPIQIVSPEIAGIVRRGLYAVVNKGNPHPAKVPGYTTAGKTGTAQKVIPGQRGYAKGQYISSFIGAVPASNPRAIVAVVIDQPQGAHYGAVVAAPVFRNLSQKLMMYWQVPPDDAGTLTQKPVAAQ